MHDIAILALSFQVFPLIVMSYHIIIYIFWKVYFKNLSFASYMISRSSRLKKQVSSVGVICRALLEHEPYCPHAESVHWCWCWQYSLQKKESWLARQAIPLPPLDCPVYQTKKSLAVNPKFKFNWAFLSYLLVLSTSRPPLTSQQGSHLTSSPDNGSPATLPLLQSCTWFHFSLQTYAHILNNSAHSKEGECWTATKECTHTGTCVHTEPPRMEA